MNHSPLAHLNQQYAITAGERAGGPILAKRTHAPGNQTPISEIFTLNLVLLGIDLCYGPLSMENKDG